MHRFRSSLVLAALLAPASLLAQSVTTSGTISFAVGGALHEGDRAAYQRAVQQAKHGFAGIEDFRLVREADESVLKFDARILPGDEDYRLHLRYEKNGRYYVDAGFEQVRIWYDGTAGYFHPRNASFPLFDDELSVDRGRAWFEAGLYTQNQTLFRFRYDYRFRDGQKDSTMWGDVNFPAPFGTRNISPAFYDLKETTHTFSFDVGNQSQENQKWNVGARVSETEVDDSRHMHRRPFDPAGERIVNQKEKYNTDLFAAHGYYLHKFTDQITVSGGALITKLDTNIHGSRIYGQSYDPVYDVNYARRQQRDEGFYNLEGNAEVKQTVLNLNGVYTPSKNWSIRPSLRFENRREDAIAEFVETNIPATNRVVVEEHLESENQKDWSEFTESVEVRYTGKPNWTFNASAEWLQGTGDLEEFLGEHGVAHVERANDLERNTQKYAASANWYARPGLTLSAQYYFKVTTNDYDIVSDSTPPFGGDRYPAYIVDQDFQTHDVNLRASWRPLSQLSLVTRYDHQESKVTNVIAGLSKMGSGKFSSDIISQSFTYSPTGRLFVTGNINVTYDQLSTPSYPFIQEGDNNYVNGSLGAGYVVSQKDDLFVDHSWFRADNFFDNSRSSLPYGLTEKQRATYLTWVRRQSENLVYTMKYGYVSNRDQTYGGLNNFDAHVIYAKVQYHF